ncbi:MAG: polyphosphate kinase 1 [Gammaproteobacteria bacterium]|nr:polyphosphate kinase 1 [Gammaproteobacteria bacterium]MCF6362016.1 polyphosphate kinase 1 [Gammaproteobacteria bacterium]
MDTIDLKQPELYINRELSLLEFNARVLEQAKLETVPLLERLRYLCISSTNMDEFFEVRVAGLMQKVKLGSTQAGPDNMSAQETLRLARIRASELVAEQYRVLNEVIFPRLAEQGINFVKRDDWSEAQEKWLREYYGQELQPILSPMGLDPAHPFPRMLNKSLNFIVSLSGKDAFGRSSGLAIVQAPRALPRVIQIPAKETGGGPNDFVFLSSVLHAFVAELFHGMKVKECYQFRVTRNSDLFVDEEEIDDLLRAVEGELAARHYGDTVRLEVALNCPDELVNFLLTRLKLTRDELFMVNGPVNLNRVQAVIDLVDRPELTFPSYVPGLPVTLIRSESLFDTIRKQDLLLHHPFESFAPVVDFVRQAAADPSVLSIKQTLYRTGSNSAIVDALVTAARAGKEVTVVVELRARFDEAANVDLATRLQEVGAHVVYGVVGYKTHAKMLLIIRRETKGLRYYTHLGTGNYHSRTARIYTDYGLFTCDKVIGEDVQKVFNQLTSLGKVIKLHKLLQSPFTLHDGMLKKIQREQALAEKGKPGRVIAKMNSLVEPQIIQALYQASQAGVQVDLIVRGVCALRPGVPGVSDNIRVCSIIGRFLEHPRVYCFGNDGNPEVFGASADWMERNLFHRVETCFPIEAKKLRDRVISDLELYLRDNTQAWLLQPDGTYVLTKPGKAEPVSAQQTLLESLAESA